MKPKMTPEDALKDIIESGIDLGAGDYVDPESLKVAAKALEKQVPTRPLVSYHKYIDADTNKEGSYHLTHCPCCFFDNHLGYFESLIDKGTAFCMRCGQAIDWEEGGEE